MKINNCDFCGDEFYKKVESPDMGWVNMCKGCYESYMDCENCNLNNYLDYSNEKEIKEIINGSIIFKAKYKDFKFSDEVLMKGTFKSSLEKTKTEFQHYIEILSSDLINDRERKIRVHFRLVMRPDIGEINFDVEFILESPQQNKIHFVISAFPDALNSIMKKIILKKSYYHAEKFAKEENFNFPPVQLILEGLRLN